MIMTGNFVAYRGGNTKYEAILNRNVLGREFTLVSVKTGRKRYNVPEAELTPWGQHVKVKSVKTTRGRFRRPATWKALPNFSGGARKTYIDEKWVYKKGHSSWGEERCAVEACRYFLQSGGSEQAAIKKFGGSIVEEAKDYFDVPIAECYLLEDGTLMMERVLPVRSLQRGSGAPSMSADEREQFLASRGNRYPVWIRHIDSNQIGVTDKGELVAYDL